MKTPLRLRVAHNLDLAIFTSLLALIPLVAIPYGTVQIFWQMAVQCAIFALGVLWIVQGTLERRWFVPEQRVLIPLVFVALYAFIQLLPLGYREAAGLEVRVQLSSDAYETRQFILRFSSLILYAALLFRFTVNERRLRLLIYTIVSTVVVSSMFGIFRQTVQRTDGFFGYERLTPQNGYAQFVNRNHFAYLAETGLGLILGFIAGGGARRDKLLVYIAPAIPVWMALILSQSRGGVSAMLGQVIFAALLWLSFEPAKSRSSRRGEAVPLGEDDESYEAPSLPARLRRSFVLRAVLLLALIVSLVVGIVWVGGESLVIRFESAQSEISSPVSNTNETSLTGDAQTSEANRASGDTTQDEKLIFAKDRYGGARGVLWNATWQMFLKHPVTGVGFGGFTTSFTQVHNADGTTLQVYQAHNDYLELMASGGIIGVLLVVWFIVWFVKIARRNFKAKSDFQRATTCGALVGIGGIVIHSFVDFGLHTTINALVLMALIVIATAKVEAQEVETRTRTKRRRLNAGRTA